MNSFLRNFKNNLVRRTYKFFFNDLDRHYSLLFEELLKKKGLLESQILFQDLHKISLLGMNYCNSLPESNGEYILIKSLSEKFSKFNLVIFDIGANIGEYTLQIKKEIPDATIHCFEPSNETFHDLKNNTRLLNGIIYNNIGIGEINKEVMLYKNSKISALASVYARKLDHLDLKLDSSEKIQITTIDQYCDVNKIERIDYLKLDVEGNEYNAFLGATKMLSEKRIRFIQFEMGGCNIHSKTSWQELYDILKTNYKVFRILKNGIYEFKEYSEFDEIFVYANYFAELKGN